MTQKSGKGSILLKLLILLLAVALILVIVIPDGIWDEEKLEKKKSQFNMSSIYEAQKFYHHLTNKYTTDKDQLLSELKKDTTLVQVQKLVNFTQKLRAELDAYLGIATVKSLLKIDQNINTIIQDLIVNERYFRTNENITNEAEQLKMLLSALSSDVNYPNYNSAVAYLDTLYQFRRDLSDFSLQTGASRGAELTSKVNNYLGNVEYDQITREWNTLAARLEEFRKAVQNSDISNYTTVPARIRNFAAKISGDFAEIAKANKSEDIKLAIDLNNQLNQTYEQFLQNYIITSKQAQYTLSLQDSMILFISEENFYNPVTKELYKIIIDKDSADVKVESPLLLEELREKVKPVADQIAKMDFLNNFIDYNDTLKAIQQKAKNIKDEIRRNIDITIKNKEIDEKVAKYVNGSEFSAVMNLREFVDVVNNSQSYSKLKESLETARNGVSILEQVYSQNLFDNIDSLNSSLIADLNEYNNLLSDIRRLPSGVEKFQDEPAQLSQIVGKIKQQTQSTNPEFLKNIQSELENNLAFAAEGKSVHVYGIFEKTLENFGYVYKNKKSWEEDK